MAENRPKTKTLCKWSKGSYVKEIDELRRIVEKPRFICRDCGRAAAEKKWLCKPTKI